MCPSSGRLGRQIPWATDSRPAATSDARKWPSPTAAARVRQESRASPDVPPSRRTPTQTFPASPETAHLGHYDARLRPVGRVRAGEVFRLQSTSGLAWEPEPDRYLPAAARAIHDRLIDKGPGVHILTGPLEVEGARPGDVLQLDILEVRLLSPYGYGVLDPLKGIFHGTVERASRWIVPIDLERGLVEVLPGVRVPARPFFGNVGVAPPAGYGRIGSMEPRIHGGNLDLKELGPGSTLFLPVHAEGARLSIGDGHALQGDGEVCLSGVETPLEGDFRVSLRRDFELTLPLALTATHLISLGFADDLDRAARVALRQLLSLLERESGVPFNDGLRMASYCVDLHVTQVVNGRQGVHAMIPRSLVEQLASPPRCLLREGTDPD